MFKNRGGMVEIEWKCTSLKAVRLYCHENNFRLNGKWNWLSTGSMSVGCGTFWEQDRRVCLLADFASSSETSHPIVLIGLWDPADQYWVKFDVQADHWGPQQDSPQTCVAHVWVLSSCLNHDAVSEGGKTYKCMMLLTYHCAVRDPWILTRNNLKSYPMSPHTNVM